jgi:hypothetical protein
MISKPVGISAAQWWVGRQQFVLSLFEKRYEVYMDVRRIASEALQNSKIDSRGLTNEIFARGQFLFGDDMVKALQRLHALAGELETGRPSAAVDINDHFDAMRPMFAKYMGVPQRMPSLGF